MEGNSAEGLGDKSPHSAGDCWGGRMGALSVRVPDGCFRASPRTKIESFPLPAGKAGNHPSESGRCPGSRQFALCNR